MFALIFSDFYPLLANSSILLCPNSQYFHIRIYDKSFLLFPILSHLLSTYCPLRNTHTAQDLRSIHLVLLFPYVRSSFVQGYFPFQFPQPQTIRKLKVSHLSATSQSLLQHKSIPPHKTVLKPMSSKCLPHFYQNGTIYKPKRNQLLIRSQYLQAFS